MADICRRLRDAREAAGLSIEEISGRTKISPALLGALEAGDFGRLPGEFYTRAFLKTYAREVGLPADEVGREYDIITHPPQPSPSSVDREHPKASGHRVSISLQPILDHIPRDTDTWAKAAFAIFLVIVATFGLRQLKSAPSPEPGAVGSSGVVQAAPAPTGTTGQTAAAPEKLTIEIRPTAPVWVAATADGNSAIYRLLKPGEQVVVEARNELSFRIGNAAAFVYTLNGVPGKPLGGPDEVREFDITRENYLTFRR